MKKIKNFIGNFLGYGHCLTCRDSWWWKKHQVVFYTENRGVFQLCTECFKKESIASIVSYHELLLNRNISQEILDWDRAKMNKARETLRNNIIKLKYYPRVE